MNAPSRARRLESAAIVAMILVAAVYVLRSLGLDSDFHVFHAAGIAAARGLDPYDLGDLSRAAGRTIELPFLYPPATLLVFAPLARLPVAAAEALWLALQAGAAVALLALWRRAFVPRVRLALFVAVALFGFGGALLWDLRTRNVASFEQLLLWSAFAAYVAERRSAFALRVALGAALKLLPIAFLSLLLAPSPRRAPSARPAAAGLALFGLIVALPAAFGGSWAARVAHPVLADRPRGEINPSVLGLVDHLLATRPDDVGGTALALGVWGAWVVVLLLASRGHLARLWRARDPVANVMAAALLFTLLAPRMMAYSYLLVIPAALWLAPRLFPRRRIQAAFWALVLLQGAAQPLPGRIDWGLFAYTPLVASLALWIAWARERAPRAAERAASAPEAPRREPGAPRAISALPARLAASRRSRLAARGHVVAAAGLGIGVAAVAGCGGRDAPPPAPAFSWVVGGLPRPFDPDGPSDPARAALERLLTHGLVREDSTGAVTLAAARRLVVAADSLVYTFHVPGTLAFTDGTPCRSAHFRAALEGGLARRDHGARAWRLAAVRGVDRVRAGRPLPALGIETPDDTTLILRLARPDRALLLQLAQPGVSDAWTTRRGEWRDVHGLGPYRMESVDSLRRLTLVRHAPGAGERVDTIRVRFLAGAARTRAFLRQAHADLVWPLPPRLLDEALPDGHRRGAGAARPARQLLLVLRADLPPTSRVAARHALAHGLNRPALLRRLAGIAEVPARWLPGAPAFGFPTLDAAAARRRMAEARLGRSFHVDLAYDADGPGAAIARTMQEEWARLAIYVELLPRRGAAWREELARGRAHLLLVEHQAPLDSPAAEVAALVTPLRGPAVGGFPTGWRTRDLDPWIFGKPDAGELPASDVQTRLERDRIVIPLAELPWVWVGRDDPGAVALDPRRGPLPAAALRALRSATRAPEPPAIPFGRP